MVLRNVISKCRVQAQLKPEPVTTSACKRVPGGTNLEIILWVIVAPTICDLSFLSM